MIWHEVMWVVMTVNTDLDLIRMDMIMPQDRAETMVIILTSLQCSKSRSGWENDKLNLGTWSGAEGLKVSVLQLHHNHCSDLFIHKFSSQFYLCIIMLICCIYVQRIFRNIQFSWTSSQISWLMLQIVIKHHNKGYLGVMLFHR